jgi:transposase-like protein
VQRFAPLFADAACFIRHSPAERWFVDETYVKVAGVWGDVYRAVDQRGQIIDVLVSKRRDGEAARRFFHQALTTLKMVPTEVVTDAAPVYPESSMSWPRSLAPRGTLRQQSDRSRPQPLKHRLRPMRGLRTDRTAQMIITGLAFLQNLRRGHYELATETIRPLRIAAAFAELAKAI